MARRDYERERARANAEADELGFSHRWAQGHPEPDEVSKSILREWQRTDEVYVTERPHPTHPVNVRWQGPDGKWKEVNLTQAQMNKLSAATASGDSPLDALVIDLVETPSKGD